MFRASWRTSAAGIVGLVGGVGALLVAAAGAISAVTDGNPDTHPNWELVGAAWGGVMASWGLMFARDNKVSSEQAGAK